MLFRKPHIVTFRHLKFKNLVRTFCLSDLKKLKSFINYYYKIENFKIEIKLNTKNLTVNDVIEIYNLNPFREKVNPDEYTLYSANEFLEKFNINDYDIPYIEIKNNWEEDEEHYIILNSHLEVGETLAFDNFSDFYNTLRQIKNSGIVHRYSLNEIKISLEDYIKVLNLYGEFNCDKAIKNSRELNQWINDARNLESVDINNITEDKIPNKYEVDDDY